MKTKIKKQDGNLVVYCTSRSERRVLQRRCQPPLTPAAQQQQQVSSLPGGGHNSWFLSHLGSLLESNLSLLLSSVVDHGDHFQTGRFFDDVDAVRRTQELLQLGRKVFRQREVLHRNRLAKSSNVHGGRGGERGEGTGEGRGRSVHGGRGGERGEGTGEGRERGGGGGKKRRNSIVPAQLRILFWHISGHMLVTE